MKKVWVVFCVLIITGPLFWFILATLGTGDERRDIVPLFASEIRETGKLHIRRHTDFEWDRLVIARNYESTFSVWKKIGYPWLGYGPLTGYGVDDQTMTWIFLNEGWVVAYTPVHHVNRIDADYVLEHSIPFVEEKDRITNTTAHHLVTVEREGYPWCIYRLVEAGGAVADGEIINGGCPPLRVAQQRINARACELELDTCDPEF